MNCKIKKLTKTAIIPTKGHINDNCYDLYADEITIIGPYQTRKVSTNIALQPDKGYGFVVRARSGKSLQGVIVGGGEVDNNYRGNIGVILHNMTCNELVVNPGDRIAQMRPIKLIEVNFCVVDELEETKRGENGFGSTGI